MPSVDSWGKPKGRRVQASGGFFDLGTTVEPGRHSYATIAGEFELTRSSSVRVSTRSDDAGDTTYVGVVPDRAAILARLARADGAAIDPDGVKVEVSSTAVGGPWVPPSDAWRSVPVRVTVTCEDCEPLAFEWRATTADETHTLVRRTGASRK
jgi:hypothetical protein